MLLFDVKDSTDGFTLDFDERRNMNQSKYKRLAIRKIKCEISDNPSYPFSITIIWGDRSHGYTEICSLNIQIGLTSQTTDEIGEIIIEKLTSFLESKGSAHRLKYKTTYDDAINIEWYHVNGSSDYFEFKMGNSIYTISHFKFEGGASSPNQYAKMLIKDYYTFISFLGVITMVYRIYINS
jgi:hypothetical protein